MQDRKRTSPQQAELQDLESAAQDARGGGTGLTMWSCSGGSKISYAQGSGTVATPGSPGEPATAP